MAFWNAGALAEDEVTVVGSSSVTATTYCGSSAGANPIIVVKYTPAL